MYASIRQYRLDSEAYRTRLRTVGRDVMRLMQSIDGFVSYHVAIDDEGMLVATSTFVTREGCLRSEALASEIQPDLLGDLVIELLSASISEVVMHVVAEPLPSA
jgi:hypothetical protein